MSLAIVLVVFIAGGFLGQVAAVVVVELVRPWISHLVEHGRLEDASRRLATTIECRTCGVRVNGNTKGRR